jgi:hypothetical protein
MARRNVNSHPDRHLSPAGATRRGLPGQTCHKPGILNQGPDLAAIRRVRFFLRIGAKTSANRHRPFFPGQPGCCGVTCSCDTVEADEAAPMANRRTATSEVKQPGGLSGPWIGRELPVSSFVRFCTERQRHCALRVNFRTDRSGPSIGKNRPEPGHRNELLRRQAVHRAEPAQDRSGKFSGEG